MKYKIKRQQFNSRRCFVCGMDNAHGLRARFYETEDNELISVFTPEDHHQSYPNRMHGGAIAAMLDETIGRAICAHYGDMVWGVTLELTTRYKKQVPLEQELKVIGRITVDHGRFFQGTGELILPNGEVAATAEGKYMKMAVKDISGESFVDNEWGLLPDGEMPAEIEL
ncbi:MAG: PaaI family thioesterase [Rikenellaceae bacterium]|nr:PaaI family thioesterase [Rikenellaceae bacterium]